MQTVVAAHADVSGDDVAAVFKEYWDVQEICNRASMHINMHAHQVYGPRVTGGNHHIEESRLCQFCEVFATVEPSNLVQICSMHVVLHGCAIGYDTSESCAVDGQQWHRLIQIQICDHVLQGLAMKCHPSVDLESTAIFREKRHRVRFRHVWESRTEFAQHSSHKQLPLSHRHYRQQSSIRAIAGTSAERR